MMTFSCFCGELENSVPEKTKNGHSPLHEIKMSKLLNELMSMRTQKQFLQNVKFNLVHIVEKRLESIICRKIS